MPASACPLQERPVGADYGHNACIRGARLDATACFHQPRAAVACHIMQWGLNREETLTLDQGEVRGPVHHLRLYVDSTFSHKGHISAMMRCGEDLPLCRWEGKVKHFSRIQREPEPKKLKARST